MKVKKKFNKRIRLGILALILVLVMVSIPLCHADGGIDLQEIPTRLAEQLNISVLAAELLSSAIILMVCLFPTIIIAGHFGGLGGAILGMVLVGLPIGGFLVVLTWLPIWVYALICVIVALMFAGKMRGWITGSGDRGD